jgi:two-component system response regulator HydG
LRNLPATGKAVGPLSDPEIITPIAELEKQAILHAIEALGGDKLEAARQLGIGKTTLYRKLKEYGAAL